MMFRWWRNVYFSSRFKTLLNSTACFHMFCACKVFLLAVADNMLQVQSSPCHFTLFFTHTHSLSEHILQNWTIIWLNDAHVFPLKNEGCSFYSSLSLFLSFFFERHSNESIRSLQKCFCFWTKTNSSHSLWFPAFEDWVLAVKAQSTVRFFDLINLN